MTDGDGFSPNDGKVKRSLKMLKGKVHKYGTNVDTDAIIPARYLNVSEPALLAAHCMEDIDMDNFIRFKNGCCVITIAMNKRFRVGLNIVHDVNPENINIINYPESKKLKYNGILDIFMINPVSK